MMQHNRLWLTLTAALVLFNVGCAAQMHDFPLCSPYPFGIGGASCDNFLRKHPERLTEAQWQARIASWLAKGWALECTHSQAIAWNKAELEKFCSVYRCTVAEEEQVAAILHNMDRAAKLGRSTLPTPFQIPGAGPIPSVPNQ